MLGRYVTGTLLILGVAMLVAPDAPERAPDQRVDVAQVARAETPNPAIPLPAADPAPAVDPVRVAAPAQPPRTETTATPVSLGVTEPELPSAPSSVIDAAVADALGALPADEGEEQPEIGGIAALAGLGEGADLEQTSASPTRTESEDTTLVYVSGSRVNVRAGPSTSFGVITSVSYGDAVELIADEGDGWSRIRLGQGGELGYMASRFLAETLGGG